MRSYVSFDWPVIGVERSGSLKWQGLKMGANGSVSSHVRDGIKLDKNIHIGDCDFFLLFFDQ
ncbi:MAG TPA: hypothetical protein ACHBZA_14180 [Arsenophonus apicola]